MLGERGGTGRLITSTVGVKGRLTGALPFSAPGALTGFVVVGDFLAAVILMVADDESKRPAETKFPPWAEVDPKIKGFLFTALSSDFTGVTEGGVFSALESVLLGTMTAGVSRVNTSSDLIDGFLTFRFGRFGCDARRFGSFSIL